MVRAREGVPDRDGDGTKGSMEPVRNVVGWLAGYKLNSRMNTSMITSPKLLLVRETGKVREPGRE